MSSVRVGPHCSMAMRSDDRSKFATLYQNNDISVKNLWVEQKKDKQIKRNNHLLVWFNNWTSIALRSSCEFFNNMKELADEVFENHYHTRLSWLLSYEGSMVNHTKCDTRIYIVIILRIFDILIYCHVFEDWSVILLSMISVCPK